MKTLPIRVNFWERLRGSLFHGESCQLVMFSPSNPVQVWVTTVAQKTPQDLRLLTVIQALGCRSVLHTHQSHGWSLMERSPVCLMGVLLSCSHLHSPGGLAMIRVQPVSGDDATDHPGPVQCSCLGEEWSRHRVVAGFQRNAPFPGWCCPVGPWGGQASVWGPVGNWEHWEHLSCHPDRGSARWLSDPEAAVLGDRNWCCAGVVLRKDRSERKMLAKRWNRWSSILSSTQI